MYHLTDFASAFAIDDQLEDFSDMGEAIHAERNVDDRCNVQENLSHSQIPVEALELGDLAESPDFVPNLPQSTLTVGSDAQKSISSVSVQVPFTLNLDSMNAHAFSSATMHGEGDLCKDFGYLFVGNEEKTVGRTIPPTPAKHQKALTCPRAGIFSNFYKPYRRRNEAREPMLETRGRARRSISFDDITYSSSNQIRFITDSSATIRKLNLERIL